MPAQAAIFDDLTALSDATRSRMLLILERHELTVSELCAVLQLPQSTVSRHLKTLGDAAWVSSRRDGTSRYYTLALDERDAQTRRLWTLLRDQVSTTAGADQDARRLKGVLARRQTQSEQFFASAAGQWDRLRREALRRRLVTARAARADRSALDGRRSRLRHRRDERGAGAVCRAHDRRRSQRRDAAGGAAPAARRANVDVRRGELESLPVADGELDAAVMMLVLHHVPDPAAVLRKRRARSRREDGSCCATCCRTTARSINSRWATSGWASATTSSGGSWPVRDSTTSASCRCPWIRKPEVRRCS